MTAARAFLRNRKTIRITSRTAMTSVTSTSDSAARIGMVESLTTESRCWTAARPAAGDHLPQLVGHLDHIGARHLGDGDQDRRLAVGHADIAHILDAVIDICHVLKPHRRTIAIGDDQAFVLAGLDGGVIGIDLEILSGLRDRALRAVGIGGGQCRAHVFEADAIFEQSARIEFDAHGGSEAPFSSTSPTPPTCDSRCSTMLDAWS